MVRRPRRQLLRRARRRAPRPPRRWPWAAAAGLVALALWWLWPEPPPPAEPPPAPVELVAAPVALHRRPAPRPPPPAPKAAQVPGRDALLAIVRERSALLRDCARGDTLARLPLRLHVSKSGKMKGVDFTGDPPQPLVASCVRRTVMGWSFDKVDLSSDVDLLVAVSFTPGT